MHIGLVVDPYGEKQPGGLGRSIFEMAKAIIALGTEHTFTVYVKKAPKEKPDFTGSNWALKALETSRLSLVSASHYDRSLDVCIFFTPIIPLFWKPRRSVVVALDFAYWRMRKPFDISAYILFFLHRRALRRADAVIAISEETKRAAMQLFGILTQRISVVRLSYVPLGEEKESLPIPEQFFLFAGVLKERKNVAGVIRAFALFAKNNHTHQLLIVGKQGGVYAQSLITLVRELGIEDRVRFLGYVTNAQLSYLYSKAQALVFPSFIEGFGMPVLEAMHAGLPVITSSTGALAEVAGDAALLVDPYRPEEVAAAMESVATDAAVREQLKEKGFARARQFSWQKTAQEILEIVVRVAHTGSNL